MSIHEELEELLAEFKREEAVFIYQSGFNCNAGTIQAITEKGDLIISDELNHASIIDSEPGLVKPIKRYLNILI